MDSIFRDEMEEELTTVRPRLCLHPFVASPLPVTQLIDAFLPAWVNNFLKDMWKMVSAPC